MLKDMSKEEVEEEEVEEVKELRESSEKAFATHRSSNESESGSNLTKNGKSLAIGKINVKVGDCFSLLPEKQFEYRVISYKNEEKKCRGRHSCSSEDTGSKEKQCTQACHDDIEIVHFPPAKRPKIDSDRLLEDLSCPICFETLAYPFTAMPAQLLLECIHDFSMTSMGVPQPGKFTCPQGCAAAVSLKDCVLNKGLDSATCSLFVEGTNLYDNLLKRRNYGAELCKDPGRAKRPQLSSSPTATHVGGQRSREESLSATAPTHHRTIQVQEQGVCVAR